MPCCGHRRLQLQDRLEGCPSHLHVARDFRLSTYVTHPTRFYCCDSNGILAGWTRHIYQVFPIHETDVSGATSMISKSVHRESSTLLRVRPCAGNMLARYTCIAKR